MKKQLDDADSADWILIFGQSAMSDLEIHNINIDLNKLFTKKHVNAYISMGKQDKRYYARWGYKYSIDT